MESSLPIWLIPTLTFVVGIVIGVILTRIMQSSSPQSTQSQLNELQERFDTYQTEVVSNFTTTAELINKLTHSYQDVQEHMLHSAERLAVDEPSRERLLACLTDGASKERITASAKPAQAEEAAPTPQEPPKDYAPKAEGEPGTLDENFGHTK